MKWTYDKNGFFIRKILHQAPRLSRYSTTVRGEVWSKIATNFNTMERPSFKVTQRSVRDSYSYVEKKQQQD